MSSLCVYVLKLENNKYYVGKSTQPRERILSHFENCGSAWTRLHKPIEVYEQLRDNVTSSTEEDITLKYMDKFGIDNVRGGSHCRIELTAEEKRQARTQFASIQDACVKCFYPGHFAAACTATSDKFGETIPGTSSTTTKNAKKRDLAASVTTNKEVPVEVKSSKKNKLQFCSRCGREKHGWKACYAKVGIDGAVLSSITCGRCGRDHDEEKCYASTDIDGTKLAEIEKVTTKPKVSVAKVPAETQPAKGKPSCQRCGRSNHTASTCFAKSDVNSRPIE